MEGGGEFEVGECTHAHGLSFGVHVHVHGIMVI